MDTKKSISILFLLLSLTVNAQNKNGLVSGPWAGNVELRNATIWVEVTQEIKNVAINFHADGGTELDNIEDNVLMPSTCQASTPYQENKLRR